MDRQTVIRTLDEAVDLIRNHGATHHPDDRRQANRDAIFLDAIAVCVEHDHVPAGELVDEALALASTYIDVDLPADR